MNLHIGELLGIFGGGVAEHLAADFLTEHAKRGVAKLQSVTITNHVKTWRMGKIKASKTDHITQSTFTFKEDDDLLSVKKDS